MLSLTAIVSSIFPGKPKSAKPEVDVYDLGGGAKAYVFGGEDALIPGNVQMRSHQDNRPKLTWARKIVENNGDPCVVVLNGPHTYLYDAASIIEEIMKKKPIEKVPRSEPAFN